MRILLVNTLYPPEDVGGAERSVEQLAAGLTAHGVEIAVATLCAGEGGMEKRGGVRVYRLPLRHLYWPYDGRRRASPARLAWHALEAFSPLMTGALARVIQIERPQLIHAHVMTGFSTSVFSAAERYGLPLVQTLRDYSTLCCRAALFRKGRRCLRRCGECRLLTERRRRATAQVDHVVGVSRAVLERHRAEACFRDTPATIIGNAADLGAPEAGPTGALSFGFLGRIEPEKGVEILLQALAGLEGDWRLCIAGRGDATYVARLKRAFNDPRIVWLGQMESHAFYQGVDVVVAPALWDEPFGRVVVEAAARGRGVIASRIGGLPEAAAGAPRLCLVEPGDVQGLARALAATRDEASADLAAWRSAAPKSPALWTGASVALAHIAVYHDVLARCGETPSRASRVCADLVQL